MGEWWEEALKVRLELLIKNRKVIVNFEII